MRELAARYDKLLDTVVPWGLAWVSLGLGVFFAGYAIRAVRRGYIYPDFKYEFAERNRVYRDDDPIVFWFAVVIYGGLGISALAMGIAGVLHLRSR